MYEIFPLLFLVMIFHHPKKGNDARNHPIIVFKNCNQDLKENWKDTRKLRIVVFKNDIPDSNEKWKLLQ